MKLLFFVQYFPPEKAAGMSLIWEMVDGLSKRGIYVVVYTSTPTRGVTKAERQVYIKEKKVQEYNDGMLTVRHISLFGEKKSLSFRSIRFLTFSIQCFFKALFIPADAIMIFSGPPSQTLVVGFLRKVSHKRII